MNCEQVNAALDLLMDGELAEDMRRELEAHGQGCPACARAIRDTLRLKALMSEIEPEVDVPLQAQAAWRGAVREAAQRDRRKRLTRWIGSAAAAVVVLVGVGLALRGGTAPESTAKDAMYVAATGAPEMHAVEQEYALEESADAQELPSPRMAEAPAENAVIEADGASLLAEFEESADAGGMCAAVALSAPAAEYALTVRDVDAACRQIIDLASEYEGEASEQRLEGGANLYVTIDAANAADFLSAVAPLDLEGRKAELSGRQSGTIQLLLSVTGE